MKKSIYLLLATLFTIVSCNDENSGGVLKQCAEITKERIQANRNSLNENDANGKTELLSQVIQPTLNLYDETLSNKEYLSGKNNSSLDVLFTSLLTTTKNRVSLNNDESVIAIKYYKSLVQLLFNILNCQEESILLQHEQDINKVMSKIQLNLSDLNSSQIKIDENGELTSFLTAYANESKRAKFIKDFVINELLVLI